jgi:blue copper oxidase
MQSKLHLILVIAVSFFCATTAQAQYNTMWIPDTLSGTNFNLRIKDTFAQVVTNGQQTITGGINGKFWGPTIFVNKGDEIHMNVTNKLNDSTTIHWHGMHLPAVMDGGPHQIIPPNTVWQPYWTIKNEAATYWYHPHLHEMTEEQITKGIGGLLIVRDAVERALPLPRKYSVDDIPLVLTDRDFNSSNQFTVVPYGDSMLTNMTLRAKYTVPAQVVRFRVLNAAIERSYNLGFSDGRTFYVITSDGGLLNAPVAKTRYLLHAGERVEILVNCTGQSGTTVDLKAYNSTLANNVAGGENFTTGPFGNALGKKDFNILRLNIGAQTANPITAIPTALTTNTLLNVASANITRNIAISDSTGLPGILGPNAFIINHKIFKINYNEYQVPLGNTEIWQITSNSVFGHPFHIHDVEFNIISVNGVAPDATQAGWKDVVFIPGRTGGGPGNPGTPSVVKFIAKFDDFADPLHPFMYHCHIALHEDEGMMGQFVVTNPVGTNTAKDTNIPVSIYPNPATERLFVNFENEAQSAYYITVFDVLGRTKIMLPKPDLKNGIDISSLNKGIYHLVIMENNSKQTVTKTFIVK